MRYDLSMPPVFGRAYPDPHPYDGCLHELLISPETYERAMARNLMCDHRVTPARAQKLDEFVPSPCTPESINRGVVGYYHEKVATRHLPDYVYKHLNGE